MKIMESPNPLVSNGVPPFSEPIMCVYIDLDRLIETAGLTSIQRRVVDLLMYGYSQTDIANEIETTQQSVDTHLRRAVRRIVKRNDLDWTRVYGKSGCS